MTRNLVRKGDTLTDPRAIAKWIAARQRLLASPSEVPELPGSSRPPSTTRGRPAQAPRSASRRTSRSGLTAASG